MSGKAKLNFLLKISLVFILLSALFTISLLMSEMIYWYLFYFLTSVTIISLLVLGRRVLTLKEVNSEMLIFNEGMSFKTSFKMKAVSSSAFLRGELILANREYALVGIKNDGLTHYYLEEETSLPRGIYFDGRLTFFVSDWFGLFHWQKKLPLQKEVVVLPCYLPEASNALWQQLVKLLHLNDSFGLRSHELKKLRNYQTGDNFRQIDWKLSAKNEGFIVREFEPEVDRQFKFIFFTSEGKSFETLLALFYSFYVDYRNELEKESIFLLSDNEMFVNPSDLNFATVSQQQDVEANLARFAQKQYTQQQLVFFIPDVTDNIIERLLPFNEYNQVSIIFYEQEQLVIRTLTGFGTEEEIG